MDAMRSMVDAALRGDAKAVHALIVAVTPVVQQRAARALVRRGGVKGRDPRQEVGDLTQEVLLVLFREDGRVLRAWDADRGLSLLNFVGLVAEREVRQIAKSGRRGPWSLDPTEDDALEEAAGGSEEPEGLLGSRDLFDRLYARLESELHDRALELFRLLVIEELPHPEVVASTGMSSDAVYAWRSRLLKRAREILVELAEKSSSRLRASRPNPMRSQAR